MTETTDTAELVITRVFNAPRVLVFKCITEPEHLTHFWGPVGTSTPLEKIRVDLRIGGEFATVMVDDATNRLRARFFEQETTRASYDVFADWVHQSRGVYTEIDPPERIAWTDPDGGMTTTSTFVDLGDGRTEVRIHQTNVPAMFSTAEAQAGFNSSLDRFDAHLASLQR